MRDCFLQFLELKLGIEQSRVGVEGERIGTCVTMRLPQGKPLVATGLVALQNKCLVMMQRKGIVCACVSARECVCVSVCM